MTREQNELITRCVEEYGGQLIQMAYRLTGSAELAKDLVQETMLTACCKITAFSIHENQKGWLQKTLWNLAIREREKAYHRDVPLETDYIEGISGIELPMEYYLPSGLKEKEREIILMRIDRRMSYADIAEIRGISEEACRQQLSRAVRRCKELMKKAEDEILI